MSLYSSFIPSILLLPSFVREVHSSFQKYKLLGNNVCWSVRIFWACLDLLLWELSWVGSAWRNKTLMFFSYVHHPIDGIKVSSSPQN